MLKWRLKCATRLLCSVWLTLTSMFRISACDSQSKCLTRAKVGHSCNSRSQEWAYIRANCIARWICLCLGSTDPRGRE